MQACNISYFAHILCSKMKDVGTDKSVSMAVEFLFSVMGSGRFNCQTILESPDFQDNAWMPALW